MVKIPLGRGGWETEADNRELRRWAYEQLQDHSLEWGELCGMLRTKDVERENATAGMLKALETAARVNNLEVRMAKWEGSKADKALDKKGAKKAGVSLKKWEGSAADDKKDKAAAKKGKR